jgi:hypothetical protein
MTARYHQLHSIRGKEQKMRQSVRSAAAILALAGFLVATQGTAWAQGGSPGTVGVVSHVKVLSDKVRDVSSMEAWKNSGLVQFFPYSGNNYGL